MGLGGGGGTGAVSRALRLVLDTNVVIDSRSGTSSDSFYNGSANKLFVATHVLTERNTTSLPTTVGDDNDAKLMRYSLVDGAWVLDEGFPVTIVGRGLSSLAIAQLTDGKVMATYTYNRRPYATNTTGTANGVSAPAATLTADRDRPPPTGMPP